MLEQLLPRPVSAAELPAPACGGSGFLCEYSERYKPLLKVGADPWEQVDCEYVSVYVISAAEIREKLC